MNSRQESNYIIEKNISKYLIFAVVILFCFGGVLQTHAIGVSPSFVEIENISNGISVSRQLNISRSDISTPQKFGISVSGEGAEYVVLSEPSIVIPKGEYSTNYIFYIEPKGASNGKYDSKIYFVSEKYESTAESDEQNTVGVVGGVIAHLSFTVTDEEIIDYEIQSVRMEDTEVGKTVLVSYLLRNNGNINTRPDSVGVRLVDSADEGHVIEEIILGNNNIPFIAPLVHAESVISMTKTVPQGRYMAEVIFYYGDEVKYVEETFLNVYPIGALSQKADFTSLTLNGEVFDVGGVVKLEATIQNIGEAIIEPAVYAEIRLDGKIVDLLQSDKKLLPKKNEVKYSLIFRPEKKGEYSIDVYFEYGIKQTEHRHVKLMVEDEDAVMLWVLRILAFLASFLLLVFVWFIMRFVKRRKKTKGIVSANILSKVLVEPSQKTPPEGMKVPINKPVEWPSL